MHQTHLSTLWNFGRRRYNHGVLCSYIHTHLTSKSFKQPHFINSPCPWTKHHPTVNSFNVVWYSSLSTHFYSSSSNISDSDNDEKDDGMCIKDEKLVLNVETITRILGEFGTNAVDAKNKLEQSRIIPTSELVVEVLSRVRNDWSAAFTFFLWAGKQEGYRHNIRECHSMISILGKMRKFDTAWALIDEMRGGKTGPSLVNVQTLMIMIRKYCAVHDVGSAINTFYALKRFKFELGVAEFQDLLGALCRYKNVQDAEHLLFCNEKVFPFDTKSFNIILNGWCNIVFDLGEAKRFWKLMGRKGIVYDTISYSSMISCYSKVPNLHEVLKLFNRMEDAGLSPDQKVYNGVIHALAKCKLVKQACDLLMTMEEKGFKPNVITYNSLIQPLCKARRADDAKRVFDEMLKKGVFPTIRTYHAFFGILKTGEEVFELLEKMKKTGCKPVNDTYIMLIRKFCRWSQIDDVFRLWNEMSECGLSHDRSSYIVLVHGLFLNGKLEEAWKYYEEMKEKGFLPEPKTEEILQAYTSAKESAGMSKKLETKYDLANVSSPKKNVRAAPNTFGNERDFLKLPETRNVTRERGFSFWK